MPAKKLRLYVSPAWRRDMLHTPLLNPFWGNPYQEASLFSKEMFDAYSFDTSLYTITADSTEADMVLPPYRHLWLRKHDQPLLDECARVAREAGIPLLIDGVGDIEYPIPLENAYILRIGGYRFIDERGRVQIPPAADDLLERCVQGELQLREKRSREKPVVGFAGWAHLSPRQYIKTIVKELPIRVRGLFDEKYRAMQKGVLWRRRALDLLQQSDRVVLNTKERASFSGFAGTAGDSMRTLRQDFVDTVLGSNYGLDVRGDANDSSRLFEILSLGRIPVIVDTERRLPFSDVVDYRSFALIIDFRDIDSIGERIAAFHESVSPEKFIEMQKKARSAFVEHFRIDALMKHIVRQLESLHALD